MFGRLQIGSVTIKPLSDGVTEQTEEENILSQIVHSRTQFIRNPLCIGDLKLNPNNNLKQKKINIRFICFKNPNLDSSSN